jgi:hypothetical protein
MRAWPLIFFVVCIGCRGLLGIDEAVPLRDDAAPPDDAVDALDSNILVDVPRVTDDIAHLEQAEEYVGAAPFTTGVGWMLDTTSLTSTPDLPPGVTFMTAMQDGGGPDLAILRADTFAIPAGSSLRVIGSRPFVVLAHSISINGALDVGANKEQPGAGGSQTGPGLGGPGMRQMEADSGGGGGGFGTAGGRGGSATCVVTCSPDAIAQGGTIGAAYNSGLGKLQGGSGGGAALPPVQPSACPAGIAGAGGGAVQLYASISITIGPSGSIDAGGGGGRGGFACTAPANFLAGNGGGSGGAIFLQSPIVTNNGVIAANGGAGGSGGGNSGNGIDGEDARVATSAAQGGSPQGPLSARGGSGGAGGQAAVDGNDSGDRGNGGGGGGAVGQLVVFYKTQWNPGTQSPGPVTQMY